MGQITINEERCKGCEICAANCPRNLIEIDKTRLNQQGYHPAAFKDGEKACSGCKVCADMCPDSCVEVYR